MHECSLPSNYRMGTTGCIIFTSQPNQQGYGNTDSCKSAHQILSPGNKKPAPHWCPDRAMKNMELVQKCTLPTRLCECKFVQARSPEHSRPRTASRVLLKAYWEKSSHYRTGEHQCYTNCRHNLNSSPRGPISQNLRSIRISTQPYENIRPPNQGYSIKNYEPRGQSPPKF